MDNRKFAEKVKGFFKKNYYYVIMSVCVVAIGTMITVAVLQANTTLPPTDDPNVPGGAVDGDGGGGDTDTGTKPIEYALPVSNSTGYGLVYDEDELQYCPTLNQWQAHYGIDYLAPAGSDVFAVTDGVVESIENNEIWGTVIVIRHEGGVRSIYKCLGDNASVLVNQKVTTGQKIGEISANGYLESASGPHLHFEMTVDNQNVDPTAYLEGNK
ncbi:MAG: M23 family metallopeptidase [Clostridiales bacterium]|jgi:murein DD-endopeptidase MepM/ murein hydrolase activator NlpD|nr:M23 family metallopeptidase [Clostridiales bacterium]